MDLAVIWGNFTCSDLACSDLAPSDLAPSDLAHSDLACSDLACSNLACSDLAHSVLARCNLACFFLSKFLLFSQYSQLGNSFSTHLNGTNLTKWNFYTLFHNNIYISTKFSMKKDFVTQTLPPPKNYIKIFKNQKLNATSQTPIQYTTFHQHSHPPSIWQGHCMEKPTD